MRPTLSRPTSAVPPSLPPSLIFSRLLFQADEPFRFPVSQGCGRVVVSEGWVGDVSLPPSALIPKDLGNL